MNNSKKQKKRQRNSEGLTPFRKSLSSKQPTASRGTDDRGMKALTGSEPLILCSSLEDLLFTDFIKCACDKEYSVLVVQGEPTDEQLQVAWVVLWSEHLSLMASKEASAHIEISAKIERMSTKIIIVSKLIEVLKVEPHESLIAELKEWGYSYQFTPESIEKDIQRVTNKIANDKTKLAIAIKEYEDKQLESSSNGEATKDMYLNILYAIEEKKKMEFDLENLTAYKFTIMYKNLIDYNEKLKQKYSGHGTK